MDPQSQWCVLWCSSCCRRKKCVFQHKGMGDNGWTSFRDEVDLYTHRQTIVAGVKPQSHRREFYRTDKRVRGVRAYLFSYSITLSTHSYHLHNPTHNVHHCHFHVSPTRNNTTRMLRKLNSRFALEHRYKSSRGCLESL